MLIMCRDEAINQLRNSGEQSKAEREKTAKQIEELNTTIKSMQHNMQKDLF